MTLGPLMIDLAGLVLSAEERERLAHPLVGGVILFARNYESPQQLRELTAAIRRVRQPAPLVAVDQEGGRVQRFRAGFTALPALRWLGHEYDRDADNARHLAFSCAWLMARELIEVGVDLSFAPCVDLDWGISEVIGDRAFHRDPEAVSALALSYLQGMRSAGMSAVAKHFPGHGAVRADSHHELPVDRRVLAAVEDDLAPYRRLIDNGLGGVMVAHVRFPEVDARIASLSPVWIRRLLRQRLEFNGAIFTDDLSMQGAAVAGTVTDRVRAALDAGADMALVCNDPAAAAAAIDALAGYQDPSAHVRLVALRAVPRRSAVALAEDPGWQKAHARLTAALERPPLDLHG
ncbi:MAG: beta-N-acetylhexosaminidase [Gammaproteobacteria bacterium]|nr:beta-N-acetylhexosaminidase [Gammaproteobacteria bacterium]